MKLVTVVFEVPEDQLRPLAIFLRSQVNDFEPMSIYDFDAPIKGALLDIADQVEDAVQ